MKPLLKSLNADCGVKFGGAVALQQPQQGGGDGSEIVAALCGAQEREAIERGVPHPNAVPESLPISTTSMSRPRPGAVARRPNDYSIPHTKVQRLLTVLADPNEVRIVDGAQVLACHRRSYDKGAQIEDAGHVQTLVAHKRAARRHRGTDQLAKVAPEQGDE